MYQFKINCKNCGIISTTDTIFKRFNQTVEWESCDKCRKNCPNILFGVCEECGSKFDILSKECECFINSK